MIITENARTKSNSAGASASSGSAAMSARASWRAIIVVASLLAGGRRHRRRRNRFRQVLPWSVGKLRRRALRWDGGCPWAGPHATLKAALIEWITSGTFNGAASGRFRIDDSGVVSASI